MGLPNLMESVLKSSTICWDSKMAIKLWHSVLLYLLTAMISCIFLLPFPYLDMLREFIISEGVHVAVAVHLAVHEHIGVGTRAPAGVVVPATCWGPTPTISLADVIVGDLWGRTPISSLLEFNALPWCNMIMPSMMKGFVSIVEMI